MKDNNSFIVDPTGTYKEIAEIEYQSVRPLSCQNIRDLLLQNGPMVIDIWGDNSNNLLNQIGSVRNYFSIIRQPSFGGKVKVDHDVLLVGYGMNDKNQKYWILQNSWGSNWAYKGFFGILDDGRPPKHYFKNLAYVKNINLKDVNTQDIKQSVGKSSQTVNPVQLNLKKSVIVENYNDDIITETGSIPPPAGNSELNTFYSMLQTVPEIKRSGTPSKFRNSFCWANKNNPLSKSIVTPTKSQGACGSCWIFAAMGMMQSAISKEKKGQELFSLSEQWVLNSIEDANKKGLPGFVSSGCQGGNTDRFKISVNGFNNFGQKYGSFGLKSEKSCPYNCQRYYQGETDCADGNKCGPPIKQNVQKTDDPNTPSSPILKSLKKIWKDNSTYIIIGIAVIVVIIIILSIKK